MTEQKADHGRARGVAKAALTSREKMHPSQHQNLAAAYQEALGLVRDMRLKLDDTYDEYASEGEGYFATWKSDELEALLDRAIATVGII